MVRGIVPHPRYRYSGKIGKRSEGKHFRPDLSIPERSRHAKARSGPTAIRFPVKRHCSRAGRCSPSQSFDHCGNAESLKFSNLTDLKKLDPASALPSRNRLMIANPYYLGSSSRRSNGVCNSVYHQTDREAKRRIRIGNRQMTCCPEFARRQLRKVFSALPSFWCSTANAPSNRFCPPSQALDPIT